MKWGTGDARILRLASLAENVAPLHPLRHPVADAQLGEDLPGAIGFVTRLGSQALRGGVTPKPPMSSIIQQPVLRGPHHDLLLRGNVQLDLNGVDGVSDGDHLDFPCIRNRNV